VGFVYIAAVLTAKLTNKGEGEQEFKVPLPKGEGFRVRANKGDMLPLTILYIQVL
jgi:hypothetical protein